MQSSSERDSASSRSYSTDPWEDQGFEVKLFLVDGHDPIPERSFLVTSNDSVVLGRSSSSSNKKLISSTNNGWIGNPVISRKHALLHVRKLPAASSAEPSYTLMASDARSMHGTFLNNTRVDVLGTEIKDGDRLRLGQDIMRDTEAFKAPTYEVSISPLSSEHLNDEDQSHTFVVPDVFAEQLGSDASSLDSCSEEHCSSEDASSVSGDSQPVPTAQGLASGPLPGSQAAPIELIEVGSPEEVTIIGDILIADVPPGVSEGVETYLGGDISDSLLLSAEEEAVTSLALDQVDAVKSGAPTLFERAFPASAKASIATAITQASIDVDSTVLSIKDDGSREQRVRKRKHVEISDESTPATKNPKVSKKVAVPANQEKHVQYVREEPLRKRSRLLLPVVFTAGLVLGAIGSIGGLANLPEDFFA